jgi:hypothetical protein
VSAEERSTLIAVSRRLREVPAKDLPLVPRAVLRCLADRANEDRIAWPALVTLAQDAGTTVPTVRRALDELLALGRIRVVKPATARDSARYEVLLEPLPPHERPARPEVTLRSPSKPVRVNAPIGQGERSVQSEVTERSARVNAPFTEDHRKGSKKDHTEDPNGHVRAHVGGGDPPGQRAVPFGPSPDAPATSTPIPASGKRAKKPGEPTAAERYIAAFVAGLAEGGRRITPPRASDGALLGRVAATHARTAAGSRIVGDALLAWIRNTATRFAKAITRPEMHRGGISAFGLQTWLDNGARAQAESFVPTDDDLDVDAANEGNPWHDPVPDFHERRPSASRAPQPRPDVTPEQAAAAIEWARSKGLMPRAPIGTPPPRERAHG